MSISIITKNLQIYDNELLYKLFNVIKNQTYNNIIEWIIYNIEDDLINITTTKFNIKLEKNSTNTFIPNGDYIINMDIFTYYTDTFISTCINKINNTDYTQINITYIYVYDFILSKLFKYSYDDEYILCIKNNKLNDNILILYPDNLLIKFNYINDNINRELLITSTIAKIDNITKLENGVIDCIIPPNLFILYNNLYNSNNNNDILEYDIVYLNSGLGIIWNPTDTNLGGSEQAIIKLSEYWQKIGKKICVYGNFINNMNVNGVDYIKWFDFPFNKNIKNLISWRKTGLLLLMNNNFICNNLIIDFHDNFSYTIGDLDNILLFNIFSKVNYFNFKSLYHKDCFIDFLKEKKIDIYNFTSKFNIIPNGIRITDFESNNNIIRNPFRFCYCSSYDRGLHFMLNKIWPKIYSHQPLAEFHIYYGMDYIYDIDFKTTTQYFLGLPGVMDHGRQSMDIIIKEKQLSTFHLYITDTIGEIDCINIKESIVSGCIPIISDSGVFKERDGLKFSIDINLPNDDMYNLISDKIITFMNSQESINLLRDELKKSKTILSWETIGEQWLILFLN